MWYDFLMGTVDPEEEEYAQALLDAEDNADDDEDYEEDETSEVVDEYEKDEDEEEEEDEGEEDEESNGYDFYEEDSTDNIIRRIRCTFQESNSTNFANFIYDYGGCNFCKCDVDGLTDIQCLVSLLMMLSSQDSDFSSHIVSPCTNETGSASDVRSTESNGGYENSSLSHEASLSHDETQSDSDLEEKKLPLRLLVKIYEYGRPFCDHASKFETRAWELIRVHCPIDYKDWRLILQPSRTKSGTCSWTNFVLHMMSLLSGHLSKKKIPQKFRSFKWELRLNILKKLATWKEMDTACHYGVNDEE
ncbi:TNF receptor-associated factor family protein DDB_G0290931-like [Papaver somniferum]|uniref:TNF receptor-associated factor family protein DDB_G0290931-like n=1 Tax=Papaver somniferum TaxID=3469 RepID=UPI000E6FAB49|nr:TNF receptor-associated factor family protein DDB_G0290931-like [Papaver somniferum]